MYSLTNGGETRLVKVGSFAVAIIAVLLARDKAPQVLLFLIGISAGIVIGVNIRKEQK